MKFSFAKGGRMILAAASVHSPRRMMPLIMGVDTGATMTCISPNRLSAIDYQPDESSKRIKLATGNGYIRPSVLTVRALRCLGQTRADFPVLCHTLPARAGVDGLLGLDFLRDFELRIDFRSGVIELA